MQENSSRFHQAQRWCSRAAAAVSGICCSWWLLPVLGSMACHREPKAADTVGKFELGPLAAVDVVLPECMRKESPNVVDDPAFCAMQRGAVAGSGAHVDGAGAAAPGGGLVGLGSGVAIDAAGAGGAPDPVTHEQGKLVVSFTTLRSRMRRNGTVTTSRASSRGTATICSGSKCSSKKDAHRTGLDPVHQRRRWRRILA